MAPGNAGSHDLGPQWPLPAGFPAPAALRAFVREDDAALAPLCCASADEAAALCARAPPHTCAQRTLDALAGPVAPAVDAAMARGLRRWFNWTGKAPSAELEARLTGSKE